MASGRYTAGTSAQCADGVLPFPPVPSTPGTAVPSPSAPTGARYTVCARTLLVRLDPEPVTETQVVAELERGDVFYVQKTLDPTWSYGESQGSATVRGWVQTRYLKTDC